MNKSLKFQLIYAKRIRKHSSEQIVNHFSTHNKYSKYSELYSNNNISELQQNVFTQEINDYLSKEKYKGIQPKLKEFVRNRRVAQGKVINECSYCTCETDYKNLQLDHVLPKEAFPDLSIFPYNLVLSCQSCNLSFGVNYTNDDGKLKYHELIHDISYKYTFDIREDAGELIIDNPKVEIVSLTADRFDIKKIKKLMIIEDIQGSGINRFIEKLQMDYQNDGKEKVKSHVISELSRSSFETDTELFKGLYTCLNEYFNSNP